MTREDCHQDTSYCVHDPDADIYGGRCYDPIVELYQQFSVPHYNFLSYESIDTTNTDEIECAHYCNDVSAQYDAFHFDEGSCRYEVEIY